MSTNKHAANSDRTLMWARDITLGGLCVALGIVLPLPFHLLGPGAGKMFLPMFLPVLFCGLLAGPRAALVTGLLTPLVSSVLTGMPPLAPTAPLMSLQLGALGVCASLLRRALGWNVWLAALGAQIGAFTILALEVLFLAPLIGWPLEFRVAFVLALVSGFPGIVLQLVVVPPAVLLVEGRSMLDRGTDDQAGDVPELSDLAAFHGHLGPYAVLGARVGAYALQRLGAGKYFGMEAWITCAGAPPESCFLDGIQVATGCTLGKQNIHHEVGEGIRVRAVNKKTERQLRLRVRQGPLRESIHILRTQGERDAVRSIQQVPIGELIEEEDA